MSTRGTVLLAMSGGVDSSVAAALLRREGYEVVGCFMRLGSPGEALEMCPIETAPAAPANALRIGHQGCCSINDAADARLVAAKLGIPLYVCNFKKDFGRIVDYFVDEYNAGRTPNPCVRCNDWLKFGKLHDYAAQIDADFVATGHYARIDRGAGDAAGDSPSPRLLRGLDHGKDQSYVLFGMKRTRLARTLLPLGAMEKPAVRAIARELGLPVFDKPDSQEICFVPDNNYAGLVTRRSGDQVSPGPIVDGNGRVLGEHPGHQHFTIGQRRGVGVAFGLPIYVVGKDAATNTITVGAREALLVSSCAAAEVNWLVDPPPFETPFGCHAQVRAHGQPAPATARRTGGEGDAERLAIEFDAPQWAVASGQAVVLYDGEVVMGGGWLT